MGYPDPHDAILDNCHYSPDHSASVALHHDRPLESTTLLDRMSSSTTDITKLTRPIRAFLFSQATVSIGNPAKSHRAVPTSRAPECLFESAFPLYFREREPLAKSVSLPRKCRYPHQPSNCSARSDRSIFHCATYDLGGFTSSTNGGTRSGNISFENGHRDILHKTCQVRRSNRIHPEIRGSGRTRE